MVRLAFVLALTFAFARSSPADPLPADVAAWKAVLAKQPHDAIAFAELVTAYRSAGRYEQLVAEYRQSDWASLVVLGRLEHHAGRTTNAIARWSAAVALKADDAATWSLLGGVHRTGGDLANARAAYDKAVAHTAHAPTKLKNLRAAIDLANTAGDDAALDRYHDLYRKLDPADPKVWRARGDALMAKGRYAAAHDAFAAVEAVFATQYEPRAQLILRRAEALEGLGRDGDAADVCWYGVTTTPEGYPTTRELVAKLVQLHRRMQTLAGLLAQLEKHWPEAKRRHFEWDTLGKVHEELGATAAAIDALQRAAALSPPIADTQQRLIRLLDTAGRSFEALRQLEHAANGSFEARFSVELAERYDRSGDRPRALETLRRIEHRFPRDRAGLEATWRTYVAWGERALAGALRPRIDALP